MQCRLCEARDANVRAHIIPRSFFVGHIPDDEVPQITSTAAKSHSKRAPIGVYDTKILCANCEARFSPYDDYGYQVFRKGNASPIVDGHEVIAYDLGKVNYALLKLFALSVLWRASVSTQPFFERVALGPYEALLRDCIRSSDPGEETTFPVVVQRYEYPTDLIPLLSPLAIRIQQVRFYQMFFGGYLAYVKVDKRNLPEGFSEIVLSPNRNLVAIARPFLGSKERKIMQKAARNARFKRKPVC